jgi:adenylate cyclase
VSPESGPLLTPRQLEVLELVAKGLPNREIARVLGISAATAKNHVAAVIEALDVTNRTEAVNALHELGLGRAGGGPEQRVAGFGERPALAVLPFDNLSADPEQALLAQGIVADLVSRLSRWRWFPVISRSSTLGYQSHPRDVAQVGRELGARYVVEGSVRRAGERVRITAQLIDAANGRHAWAARYDRALADLFAVEDEIADTIVTALEPALARIEGVRVLAQPPGELGVWECLQRGFLHLTQLTAGGLRGASALFERAIELDPKLSLGFTGLAFSLVGELLFQLAPDRAAAAARVLELSQQALARDANDAVAHFTLGLGHLYAGDPEATRAANERALELNPSVTWAHGGLGVALCALSPPRADEAAAALETAIRLSPHDPFLPYLLVALANARSLQGRLEEALRCGERSRRIAPDLPVAYGGIAFCHVALGRVEEARRVLAELAERHPGYSPVEQARAWVAPENLPVLQGALAAAGWVDPGEAPS